MARLEEVHQQLLRWAEWLKAGRSSGYPARSVLHPSWSPPSGRCCGAVIRSGHGEREVRDMHMAVEALAPKLRAAIAARYLLRMSRPDAADACDCQPDTLDDRIERACRAIQSTICNIRADC